MTPKQVEKYVSKLDHDDLYQEWSIADLVWLVSVLHGALYETLTSTKQPTN
jgi:hypothetical protein